MFQIRKYSSLPIISGAPRLRVGGYGWFRRAAITAERDRGHRIVPGIRPAVFRPVNATAAFYTIYFSSDTRNIISVRNIGQQRRYTFTLRPCPLRYHRTGIRWFRGTFHRALRRTADRFWVSVGAGWSRNSIVFVCSVHGVLEEENRCFGPPSKYVKRFVTEKRVYACENHIAVSIRKHCVRRKARWQNEKSVGRWERIAKKQQKQNQVKRRYRNRWK